MDSQKRYPGIQLGGVVRDMPHCLELDTGGPQEGAREVRPEGPARRGTCPRGAEPVKRVLSREHQSKETGEMALCAAPPRPPAPRPASNQVQVQPNLGPTHPPRASNRRSYQVLSVKFSWHSVKRETEVEECSGRDVTPHCGKNDRKRPSDLKRGHTQAVFENYNAKPPRKHLPSFEATHSNSERKKGTPTGF
jgi:hypothetical protein